MGEVGMFSRTKQSSHFFQRKKGILLKHGDSFNTQVLQEMIGTGFL